jgi:hypothetical protein
MSQPKDLPPNAFFKKEFGEMRFKVYLMRNKISQNDKIASSFCRTPESAFYFLTEIKQPLTIVNLEEKAALQLVAKISESPELSVTLAEKIMIMTGRRKSSPPEVDAFNMLRIGACKNPKTALEFFFDIDKKTPYQKHIVLKSIAGDEKALANYLFGIKVNPHQTDFSGVMQFFDEKNANIFASAIAYWVYDEQAVTKILFGSDFWEWEPSFDDIELQKLIRQHVFKYYAIRALESGLSVQKIIYYCIKYHKARSSGTDIKDLILE